MKKFLQNSLVVSALMIAASLTATAQTLVVNENFQTWTMFGYTSDPGSQGSSCPGGVSSIGTCESTSFSPGTATNTVTKTYAAGSVTYTIVEGGVAPQCPVKSGCSATCPTLTGTDIPGLVQINKTETAAFETSEFANITTVELAMSWTGSNRNAIIQKSVAGGAWTTVQQLFGGSCSQYGVTFSATGDEPAIAINENNVKIRIIADNSAVPTSLQQVRIHNLKVYGAIVAGVQNASWTESGVSIAVDNNKVTLTSENLAGSVDVVSTTGSTITQKAITKGGQTSFEVPSSGLYIVRFTSDNKVFTKKVAVN